MKVVNFQSNQMFNAIDEQIELIGKGLQQNRKQYVIVPDRFSLNMEKRIMEHLNLTATFDMQVLTMSRFANLVLNNYGNKTVIGMLDAVFIVEYLLKENKDKMQCFTHIPINTDFAKVLFDSISQIKSCNITPAMLKYSINKLPQSNLKAKMSDITLIYELYEQYIQDNFIDSNNKITLLAERLKTTDMFRQSDIHFCNFLDFSEQDYNVIQQIIRVSNSVSITTLFGESQNNEDIYNNIVQTRIKDICDIVGVEIKTIDCVNRMNNNQQHICSQLFSLNVEKTDIDKGAVNLFVANDIQQEVDFVVKNIVYLIKQGVELKDICINCVDLNVYSMCIKNALGKYKLPYWIDQNIKLESIEYCKLLKSIFDCVQWNFQTEDVLRTIMNGLIELTAGQKSLLYCNAKKYGVVGSMWTNKITLKNEDEEFMQFESLKQQVMQPIIDFYNNLQSCITISQYCSECINLIQNLNLEEQTNKLSLYYEEQGDLEQASILRQSHEKIIKIIDQLQHILGDKECSFTEWTEMFYAGVQSIELAPMPIGVNNILVGQMLSTMFEPAPYYFVVGAIEDKLPAWMKDVGIISDEDIAILADINLTPTINDLNKKTILVVQQNLTLATTALMVTAPINIGNQQCDKSRVMTQLSTMFVYDSVNIPIVEMSQFYTQEGVFKNEQERLNFMYGTEQDLLNFIVKNKENIDIATIRKQVNQNNVVDYITEEHNIEQYIPNAEKLFFTNGYTKATELEKYFACPFQHFIEYGLKLKEQEQNNMQPVDIGNILHDIVEKYAKYSNGDILFDDDIQDFAIKTFNNILTKKEYEHLMIGSQNKAIIKGLEQESIRICKALNHQNMHSKYKIVFAEATFGDKAFVPMPEIMVYNTKRILKLKGKVDRVDIYNKRFRVVDYKTGKSKSEFSMLDLYLGKKIQLFVYLYAIYQNWKDKLPSGAFYFPLHNEYLNEKPDFPYQSYCMKGITILDDDNFLAQDDQVNYEHVKSGIVNFSLVKNKEVVSSGELKIKDNKDTVTQIQMYGMLKYAYNVLSKGISEILQGYIEPKPLKDGCKYCASKSFCPHYTRENIYERIDNFEVKKEFFEEDKNE